MKKIVTIFLSGVFLFGADQLLLTDAADAAIRLGRLRRSPPVTCGGNQRMRISHRLIEARGVAIVVRGNCHLTISRSHIVGGRAAIRVEGNGRVTLGRSVIDGRPAIWVGGNGTVRAKRSDIYGAVIRRDNGEFRRRGSVMIRGRRARVGVTTGSTSVRIGPRGVAAGGVRVGRRRVVAPGVRVAPGSVVAPGVRIGRRGVVAPGVRVAPGSVSAPGARIHAHGVSTGGASVRVGHRGRGRIAVPRGMTRRAPIRCGGNQNIVVRNAFISSRGPAVIARANCDVKLINCHIVSTSDYALVARGAGDIWIRRSTVEGRRGAVLVRGNGDVTARRSTFIGRIKRRGNGDFNNKGGNVMR